MAYLLNHNIEWENRIGKSLRIELYKKDFVVDEPTTLTGISCVQNYPKNENGKFDDIISCELRFTVRLKDTDTVNFTDLFVTYDDEWKVIVYVNEVINFVGFLVPGEGTIPYRDKPYNIQLTATDGLGLLKGVSLSNLDGERFTGVNLQIDYIAAILAKTGSELPIRVYSSVVEESMDDRDDDPDKDTLNQSALHARSFLKEADTFYDCYKCLQIIYDEYFTLYQWQGMWVIRNNAELQTSVGLKNWYTDYDNAGAVTGSAQDLLEPCPIGRTQLLEPINLSANLGSRIPSKSVKTKWDYNVWPELPANNKFERGDIIPGLSAPGETAYTIADWEYIKRTGSYNTYPFGETAATQDAYSKRFYNAFGVEIDRQIIVEKGLEGDPNWLRSDSIPVNKGDKISLSIDKRFDNNVDAILNLAHIYIVDESNTNYYGWLYDFTAGDSDNKWQLNQTSGFFSEFTASEDLDDDGNTQFHSVSGESAPIPIDGTLYVVLLVNDSDTLGAQQYFKNFNFEYIPYIAGGYIRIKGDYWFTEQDLPLKQILEKDVLVSDSLKKVLKGAIYRANLTDLTTPTWHRFQMVESRQYKELINLARFNNEYRRFYEFTGTIMGVTFSPFDDPDTIEPLSFHRHFYLPSLAELANRYFILTPPLSIDHAAGRHTGTYVECLDATGVTSGGSTPQQIVLQLVAQLQAFLQVDTFVGSAGGSGGASWTFTIDPNVKEGDFFRLVMNITGTGIIVITTYTAALGDDENDVAAGLYANISGGYGASQAGNQFILTTPSGSSVVQRTITPLYNLQAAVGDLTGDPIYFRVYCGDGDTVTVETDDGGAANSPVITEISNTLTGDQRLYIFRVESDIDNNNVFTVHVILANGDTYDAEVTTTAFASYTDGSQEGDVHVLKYVF